MLSRDWAILLLDNRFSVIIDKLFSSTETWLSLISKWRLFILSFFFKIISYYSEVIITLSIHAMPIFILYFHSYSFLFSEMLLPLPFYLNPSRQLRKHSLDPPRYLPWIPVIPIVVFCTIAISLWVEILSAQLTFFKKQLYDMGHFFLLF